MGTPKDNPLSNKIKRLLEEKMQTSAMDINVYVRNGVAQLTGFVDVLSEKIFAEEIAAQTPGIIRVENSITIGTEGYIIDRHIERELESKLHSGEHGDLDRISVDVKNGNAVLMGTAVNYAQNRQAESLAAGTRGVINVVSNIRIRNEGIYDDATLAGWAVQALSTGDLSFQDINTDIWNGEITLSGWVNTRQEMELAERLVSEVEGIRKVHNRLQARNQQ